MSAYKEIVTKTIVGKGSKKNKFFLYTPLLKRIIDLFIPKNGTKEYTALDLANQILKLNDNNIDKQ